MIRRVRAMAWASIGMAAVAVVVWSSTMTVGMVNRGSPMYYVLGIHVSRQLSLAAGVGSLALLCISVLLLAWCTMLEFRRRFRIRNGLCTSCGYDLRASSEVCPECGQSVRGGE